MFQSYFTEQSAQAFFLHDGPMCMYISVNRGNVPQSPAYLSWKTLAKLTGQSVGQISEAECAKKNADQDQVTAPFD